MSSPEPTTPRFELRGSHRQLTSYAGLSLIGQHGAAGLVLDRRIPLRAGMTTGGLFKSVAGGADHQLALMCRSVTAWPRRLILDFGACARHTVPVFAHVQTRLLAASSQGDRNDFA